MPTLRIIVVTTGENRTQEYSLVNRKQAEGYKRAIVKEQYRLLSRGRNWVASYHAPIREVIMGLTLTEVGAIIKLLPFLRFKSDGKLIKQGEFWTRLVCFFEWMSRPSVRNSMRYERSIVRIK
ncbi:hypothetical protein [Bacillus toyonensis]|uniref:hypothetical protein n=1 Tax=Bacillus toyonensis TaxID=155322 RepID=UPI00211D26A5|nr:hypothetical protein [Bacillus toyonensis]